MAAILLGLNLTSSQADQPPKIGTSCPIFGAEAIVNNVYLLCKPKGTKLIWSKSTKAEYIKFGPHGNGQNNSGNQPKPNSFSIKSNLEPMPVSLPVKSLNGITFANLESKESEIAQDGWANAQSSLTSGSEGTTDIQLAKGPNTPDTTDTIIARLKTAQKYWSGFTLPANIFATAYNAQDEQWAESRIKSMPNYAAGLEGAIQQNCNVPVNPQNCNSDNSGVIGDKGGHAIGDYGISDHEVTDPNSAPIYRRLGANYVHEFTHTVQGSQFLNASLAHPDISHNQAGQLMNDNMPCWIIEGQANFAGASAVSNDFATYSQIRLAELIRTTDPNMPQYTPDLIKTYLTTQIPGQCRPSGMHNRAGSSLATAYNLGYSVGMLAIETLSAIAGPKPTMALYTLVASGDDFATAFKKIYGVTWDSAATTIANVIAFDYEQPDVKSQVVPGLAP